MKLVLTFLIVLITFSLLGQTPNDSEERVIQTFRHTRVINNHSVETLPARKLDFRIVHRFGDLAGDSGGWPTFFGLESASDVSIGFEYGITDQMMIGINRTAGVGPLKQNLNGLIKFKLMSQKKNGNAPFSLAVHAIGAYSTMPRSTIEGQITSFDKNSHRLAYHLGLNIARKFSDAFSLQLGSSWTYRNVVDLGDTNDIVAISAGARIQLTKALGLILDAAIPLLTTERITAVEYTAPIGIGFEFDTSGGHVFQFNVTNSRAISETDFIPYTSSRWQDGSYRFGFTISRLFSL